MFSYHLILDIVDIKPHRYFRIISLIGKNKEKKGEIVLIQKKQEICFSSLLSFFFIEIKTINLFFIVFPFTW